VVLDPVERIVAGLVADVVLAFEMAVEQTRPLRPFGHQPLHPIGIDLDAGQAILVFVRQSLVPKTIGLIAMAIGGDHYVLLRIVRSGATLPPDMPGGIEPPPIGLINRNVGFLDHFLPPS